MEGVKVLYEVSKSDNMIAGIALLLIAIVTFLFAPIVCIFLDRSGHSVTCVVATFIASAAVFFLIYQGISRMIPRNYKLVSIDDSVTVNEFYECYEIHEKTEYGYFVKERNVEDGDGV